MPTLAPISILASVARHVQATTGIRASARRAPLAWRDGTDPGPYVVVTQVSPFAPALRGDGVTLRDVGTVQASLWEAETAQDDARLESLLDALDGSMIDLDLVGTVLETSLVPDEDTTQVHHALTVRYLVSR